MNLFDLSSLLALFGAIFAVYRWYESKQESIEIEPVFCEVISDKTHFRFRLKVNNQTLFRSISIKDHLSSLSPDGFFSTSVPVLLQVFPDKAVTLDFYVSPLLHGSKPVVLRVGFGRFLRLSRKFAPFAYGRIREPEWPRSTSGRSNSESDKPLDPFVEFDRLNNRN